MRYREVCGLCGAIRRDQQIGIEGSLGEYVARLVQVFDATRKVLAADGTLWLNIGDGYASGQLGRRDSTYKAPGSPASYTKFLGDPEQTVQLETGTKDKDLTGAPWAVAFALREAGWYLRSCVIWDKTNAMPESAKDRPTDAHEYVFLLSPGQKYRFRHVGRNHVRSVWRGPTANYKGAHVAVMPLWLAQRCIPLTTKSGDVVLDPFAGTGTTLVAALLYGRRAVGIDLLMANCGQQARRIENEVFKPARAAVAELSPAVADG